MDKSSAVDELLILLNYLLLQERINEAITLFKRIKSEYEPQIYDLKSSDSTIIQYDYAKAFIDFQICSQNESIELKDAR
jgi:hypothetical protein